LYALRIQVNRPTIKVLARWTSEPLCPDGPTPAWYACLAGYRYRQHRHYGLLGRWHQDGIVVLLDYLPAARYSDRLTSASGARVAERELSLASSLKALSRMTIGVSMIQAGVNPWVVHFFAFFLAVFGELTPPTSLVAAVTAKIANASFYRVLNRAMQICISLFTLMVAVFVHPELVIKPGLDQIGAAYGWGKVHGPDEWWHVDYLG